MIQQEILDAYTAALIARIEEITAIHAQIGIMKVSLPSFPSLGGLDIEQAYNADVQQKVDRLHDEASQLLMNSLIYLTDLRISNIGLTNKLLVKHLPKEGNNNE